MPAARGKARQQGSGGARRVLVVVGGALAAVVAVAVVAWLLFAGGAQKVVALLPPGIAALVGEKSVTKLVPRTADPNGAPWDHPGNWDKPGAAPREGGPAESADDEGAPEPTGSDDAPAEPDENAVEEAAPASKGDVEQAAAAATLAPIKALAQQADDAIARYERSPNDQAAYLAANKAVEALKGASISADTAALRTAALELRGELAVARREALDAARQMARATHRVVGTAGNSQEPFLALREAAAAGAPVVAELVDGTLVRVHLDNGDGWLRVEAVTGDAASKSGYARGKHLKKLDKSRPSP